MPGDEPRAELLGRRHECAVLDGLEAAVGAGSSRALVVHGEAGIGKSTLLDYLADRASSCRVVRAAGVESEMELPFAGLHQLLRPIADQIDELPPPQRDALEVAFGLRSGPVPDRFLVGVAVLGLVSVVAEERGLVCIVDDAQWLDRASIQVLAFVARRLLAESVAIVFAVRAVTGDLDGLPELPVSGLATADARVLLDSIAAAGSLDELVRARIIDEARGNPLALHEFASGVDAAEVEFGFAPRAVLTVPDRIEHDYIEQVRALPVDAQRLVLVAAIEPVGDGEIVRRAAAEMGIGLDAVGAAEATGLVTFGPRTRFRHPLVRSAVCRAADAVDMREAHRALADVTDADADADRRAWHRASAALAADEAVAADLERAAERAQRRGGMVAAAAFLQRATELTPDAARRGRRAVAGAWAKFQAADLDGAMELVATAELCPRDDVQRAELELLRASRYSGAGRWEDAPERLGETATRLGPIDAPAARSVHLHSLGNAMFRSRFGGEDAIHALASAARAAPAASAPPRPIDLLLDGVVAFVLDGCEVGSVGLRRALEACEENSGRDGLDWLMYASIIAPEVGDDAAWDRLTVHLVQLARGAGVLLPLPNTLDARARCLIAQGQLAAAAAVIDEAELLCAAIGTPRIRSAVLELGAWQGREAFTVSSCAESVAFWSATHNGRIIGIAAGARAVLYNGLGRYDAALDAALEACAHDDIGSIGAALVELVEAAARAGDRPTADAALARLARRAQAAGTDWPLGLLARSRALLGDDETAEAHYVESIERLGRTRIRPHLARARLVYGEWLRRRHRRVEARAQLRDAYESLAEMGIEGFAERARRELVATGETAPRRTATVGVVLTQREAQIARLAGDRHTNPEIAAQLLISPRTVEYHLANVFPKLGVTSRRELPGALRKLGIATATT